MPPKKRTAEVIEKELVSLGRRRRRAKKNLDDIYADQRALLQEGRAAGLSIRYMAKVAQINEQAARNICNNRYTYQSRKERREAAEVAQ